MKYVLSLAALALLVVAGTSDGRCKGRHRLGHRLGFRRARVVVVVPAQACQSCQPAAIPKAPLAKKVK